MLAIQGICIILYSLQIVLLSLILFIVTVLAQSFPDGKFALRESVWLDSL